MITPPNRGIWHRRDERGGAKPPIAGAHQRYACSFCDKRFRDQHAVTQHERQRHKQLMRRRLIEINIEADSLGSDLGIGKPKDTS